MLFVWAIFTKTIFKFLLVWLITRGDKNNELIKEYLSSEKCLFRKKVNMDLNRCYEQYAEYFRITFPFTAPPKFQEWLNDISATSAAGFGSTTNEESGICREQTQKLQGETGSKGESWTKNKALF